MQYSVVIPVKDEEENLKQLVKEIDQAMQELHCDWELLAIDDGSTDQSLKLLLELKKFYPQLKIITFDRNYGQSSAFHAGFKEAKGEWIITLDADLQNDPKDIPKLASLTKNYDLICGIRQKRQDSWSKKNISKFSNFIRSRLCNDGVSDTGCSLKIFNREKVCSMPWFHGAHRFIPALFTMNALRIGQLPVSHRPRNKGKSKYNLFNRSFGPAMDLLGMMWLQRRQLTYKITNKDQATQDVE